MEEKVSTLSELIFRRPSQAGRLKISLDAIFLSVLFSLVIFKSLCTVVLGVVFCLFSALSP